MDIFSIFDTAGYNITEFLKIQKTLEILPIAFINFPFYFVWLFGECSVFLSLSLLSNEYLANLKHHHNIFLFFLALQTLQMLWIFESLIANFSCLSNGWISLVSLTYYYEILQWNVAFLSICLTIFLVCPSH